MKIEVDIDKLADPKSPQHAEACNQPNSAPLNPPSPQDSETSIEHTPARPSCSRPPKKSSASNLTENVLNADRHNIKSPAVSSSTYMLLGGVFKRRQKGARALLVSIVEYGAGVWAHQLRGDRAKRKLGGLRRGEVTPEHVTLECIFTEREREELLTPIQANAIYHILRDVDRWRYLDEIANRVSKVERDIHMNELKESIQRQNQDSRQNRQEETTEEEVASEDEGDVEGEETSDLDETFPNW
uniref:Uncharacterized protein n=1 Tax=Timema cristinae TaxID=61476 RepID=A0A7R9D677_TIMCR|nr:unnamed protein product [Timema cristinae]